MNETHGTLRENLRALPRGAWILFFGSFLNKFGTFVLPFLAIYMQRLGYSVPEAGLAVAAFGLGHLVAAALGGVLADRLGRRETIVLSMVSVAGTMLCLSQARQLASILTWSALAGLTGELYRPAAGALLADLVPAGQRVTAFAAYRMAFNAGWMFGPATAGFLAKHSFTWLFIGDAFTSLLFGLVAWLALPAGARGGPARTTLGQSLRVLAQDPRLRQVLLAWLPVGMVFMQVCSTMSLEVTRHGFAPAIYGLLISINGAMVVLCELPLTTLTRRFPPRRVIAVGYVLIGAGFASNVCTRTLPLLALSMAVLTLGEMISMPVAAAYVADLAPAHQRGLYMGTFGLAGALTLVCGPSLGMMLFAVSPAALWSLCGVLGLVGAGMMLPDVLAPPLDRRGELPLVTGADAP
jgi:MFS family permease